MMKLAEVKRLVASHGPRGFNRKLVEMLSKKRPDGTPMLKPEEVSIRGLWEALVGPIEDTLGQAHQAGNAINFVHRDEEITSSHFPIAVGALIAAKVIEVYNSQNYIGDKLVMEYDSSLKVDTIPGFTAVEGPLEVDEGKEYQDSSFDEKFVTMTAKKRGRIISVTEEAILFDRTGLVLIQASKIADKLRLDKERRIIKGVCGATSDVWKPANVATAVYSAGNKNLVGSNALTDWQSIDACLKKAAEMMDEQNDEILVDPTTLLVPRALWGTAQRIVNATATRSFDPVAAPQMATYSNSPFSGQFPPLSSPLLDTLVSQSHWFMGDFKKAFWYKKIWPIQTMAAKEGNEDEFDRDVKFKFKVREYGEVNCIDPRYVFKNTVAA